jgi:hypothetical protein
MNHLDHMLEELRRSRPQTETDRILSLPIRSADLGIDLTSRYSRYDHPNAMKLWPIQSKALAEIEQCGGLLAPIGVGHGKTLIALLAAKAARARQALILCPAALAKQMQSDYLRYSRHFELPVVPIMSYAALSRVEGAETLEELKPDLVICDEVHKLRNPKSARTRRVKRYFRAHPGARMVALSGTITNRSLLDYAHIAQWALGERSPLPRTWAELQSWAQCIDVGKFPSGQDKSIVEPLLRWAATSDYREAFRRRFLSAPGVVSTPESSIGSTLIISRKRVEVPKIVQDALDRVEATWESPSGEQFDSAMQKAECERQLSQGFYYEWVWPNNRPDFVWLESRAQWNRAVREVLKRNRPGLDSPALVRLACESGNAPSVDTYEAWQSWQVLIEQPAPPVRAVWLSLFLIDDACEWVREGGVSRPRILWYSHRAVGDSLAARLPVYGPDREPPERAKDCAMSIRAHGTGRNLQAWSESLVLCPPANGSAWEQLIGRTHRKGQTADEVLWSVYQHTDVFESAIASALEDAQYQQATHGQRQRLLYAAYTDEV